MFGITHIVHKRMDKIKKKSDKTILVEIITSETIWLLS